MCLTIILIAHHTKVKKIVNKKIDSVCLNDTQGNPIDDVIKWLAETASEAQLQGYTSLKVRSDYYEGDECSLPRNYLSVYGNRKETDEEHKKRIDNIIRVWSRHHQEYVRMQKFFSTPHGKKRIEVIEDWKNNK